MNLIILRPFRKLKISPTHSNHFALWLSKIKNLFKGRVSLEASRLGRARDGKTRLSKINKKKLPLFRENYVDSDFSIALRRYVGMKSTTLSSSKINKINSFLISPIKRQKRKKAKHSHKHKQKGSCGVPQM